MRKIISLTKLRVQVYPNSWDFCALILVLTVLVSLGWGLREMTGPYQLGQVLPVSLSPAMLPSYALQSVLRMAIAMVFSFLFTFTIGTWAAKSPRAERLIIPMIDICQSVPIIGMLSITVVGFIRLFPGSLWGAQWASIFAVFISQVWNMTLSFYQSLKMVPSDLQEAAHVFQLSSWQRFWRVEVPFSTPNLLWNTMMSMSGGWFFVVASEAITVSNQNITLPGIGSYIALAIVHANMQAVLYAIIAMLVVIVLYDQLLFRPLICWSDKFNFDETPQERTGRSWLLSLLQHTRLLPLMTSWLQPVQDHFIRLFQRKQPNPLKVISNGTSQRWQRVSAWSFATIVAFIVVLASVRLVSFISQSVPHHEILRVFYLGFITAIRVFVLIALASLIWVPIGVWIGSRPRIAQIAQPIVQFLAAFPAYLFFPVVVYLIVKFDLNVNIWTSPLMILGTQWYILFNVVAGAAGLPKELHYAADNFGVFGWQRWKRLILPGIFPAYITGAITAAGGAWNASVVAEVVSWGHTTLRATGLGAYIAEYTSSGNFPRIALGIVVMCIYVLLFNHILWRPLYTRAEKRFRLESS